MNLLKNRLIWLLLGLFVLAGVMIYPYLPEQVPSHWNIDGEVDRYSSREFGAFFPPAMAVGMFLLLGVIPYIDPKGANFKKYGKVYDVFVWLMIIFFVLMGIITWLAALGYALSVGKIICALVALLFIVIGNYLPKIQYRNYTFGIRTPWTLDNEEVWRQTHRWAGKVMVVGGIIALLGLFATERVSFWLLMAGVLLPSLGATIYSYLLYRKIAGPDKQD
ncbi:MAG: SdpI family protein [Firmicutes bacterium]|nr:SdpI family protein [Bacillota bacterium]